MATIGMLYICTGKYTVFWPEFYETFSRNFLKYADALASGNYPENLRRAIDIENGKIINPEIRRFREERGLFCE